MADFSKHPNHRPVTIHRAGSILSRAQGVEVDDFFADSKQGVGSYYDSVNSIKIGTGLDTKEEELLLPNIIDTPKDDKEFRKKLSEFYADLNTPVPYNRGTTLETGLEVDNDKPVSKDNMPLNLMEYIRWRHALRHPWVAENKQKADGNQTKQFYIFDKAALASTRTDKGKNLDAAMQIFLKIKNEDETVSQLMSLLGVDPTQYGGKNGPELRVEALRETLQQNPEKFAKTYDTGDIEIRYWLKNMAAQKVLKQIGERFINPEDDKLIASTEEEMIFWMKDEENSEKVTVLKARLQEALAKTPATNKRKTVVTK